MEETDYLAFRKRFPIFNSKVYLNSCSQGAISDAGEAAMQDYLDSWRSQGSPWEHWMEVQEELRQAFAAMIGALPEEIAITSSASAGIYSIASSLRYDERSSVVLGELEFPTQCYVWLAQQTRGAVIEWVPARDGAITADEYRTHLDSRTLIVPTTHVCFRNGYRQDVCGHCTGRTQSRRVVFTG
ncbi:MAG: aminotransferase class V-fold PLP-dependent enzyme [Blastocatellia bacterium]